MLLLVITLIYYFSFLEFKEKLKLLFENNIANISNKIC